MKIDTARVDVVEAAELAPVTVDFTNKRVAFIGCGDSLAAARPAEFLGHRALSAGDLAWGGFAPRGVSTVVPLSWSGRTGATIAAARVAAAADLEVVGITTAKNSPLGETCSQVVEIPALKYEETIPVVGYIVHSLAIAATVGSTVTPTAVAEKWRTLNLPGRKILDQIKELFPVLPQGITISATADAYGAAEFWVLKLIEALGISVRLTGIEELGHVDYFMGPQPHLIVMISGNKEPRVAQLGEALQKNGMGVVPIALEDFAGPEFWLRQIMGGVLGAELAAALAHQWNRPPFRGGAVDMSARHIQVAGL